MRYFAGIDGGGTTTDIVLVSEDGSIASRVQGETSNKAVVGMDKATEVLRALIMRAVSDVRIATPLAGGWIGLAGADRPHDREAFHAALLELIQEVRITNDAELVLSGNPDGIGIALIGGTGSIAFARNEAGASGRSGGWGHIFGDEGSAWGLAVDALRAVAAAVDGRGPDTALVGALLDFWRVSEPQELISRIYDPSTHKSDVAASAPAIVEVARSGDTVASGLLENAGTQLASLVPPLLHRIPFSQPPSIAATGGMLLQVPEVRESAMRHLADQPCQPDLALVTDVALSAAQSIRAQYMKERT